MARKDRTSAGEKRARPKAPPGRPRTGGTPPLSQGQGQAAQQGTYALADEFVLPDEANGHPAAEGPDASGQVVGQGIPTGQHPWQAMPGKRVSTTIGRGRPQPAQVLVDPNARVVRAFRPHMTIGQVGPQRAPGTLDYPGRRPAPLPFRRLRPLVGGEAPAYRAIYVALAAIFAFGFCWLMLQFVAAAHLGGEQNAALVAGKQLARTGSLAFVPPGDFAFVGSGWAPAQPSTAGDAPSFYPVTPAGLPLIYAATFIVAPNELTAINWAHRVAPLAAALAVLGVFYLTRFAGGSFLAALAMIAFAGSYALLERAHDPAGHAVAVALVVWGAVALLAWWRSERVAVQVPLGIVAGLLLGCAFTVRYSEGVLAIALLVSCISAWQWRRPLISGLRVLPPLAGWALPVGTLLVLNRRTTGTWLGPGHEHSLLSWEALEANWNLLAGQLGDVGLYFLLPLGLTGALVLCARRLPLGLVILGWMAGVALVNMAWTRAPGADAPHLTGLVLTALPAVLFAASYLLWRVLHAPASATGPPGRERPAASVWRRIASPVAAGLIVAASVALGSHRAVAGAPVDDPPPGAHAPSFLADYQLHLNLERLGLLVRAHVPQDAVVFADPPSWRYNPLHHLQLAGDWALYDARQFTGSFAARLSDERIAAEGAGLTPQRLLHLRGTYADLAEADLSARAKRIVDAALDEGREVWLVMSPTEVRRFRRAHLPRGYDADVAAVFEWVPLQPGAPAASALLGEWQIARITRHSGAASTSADDPPQND